MDNNYRHHHHHHHRRNKHALFCKYVYTHLHTRTYLLFMGVYVERNRIETHTHAFQCVYFWRVLSLSYHNLHFLSNIYECKQVKYLACLSFSRAMKSAMNDDNTIKICTYILLNSESDVMNTRKSARRRRVMHLYYTSIHIHYTKSISLR